MGCGITWALTHRFPGTVAADDEREGLGKHDGVVVLRGEGPDALNQHLIDGAHGGDEGEERGALRDVT